jgi:hypothetical protein
MTGGNSMLPSTVDRVPVHTAEEINEQIRRQTEASIAHYGRAGNAAIDRRLKDLDEEWDIERMLEANAATASLIGLTLGATVDRRWFLFPAVGLVPAASEFSPVGDSDCFRNRLRALRTEGSSRRLRGCKRRGNRR